MWHVLLGARAERLAHDALSWLLSQAVAWILLKQLLELEGFVLPGGMRSRR